MRQILKIGDRLLTVNNQVVKTEPQLTFKGKLRVTVAGGDFGFLNEGVHIVELQVVDTVAPSPSYYYDNGNIFGTGSVEGTRIFARNNDTQDTIGTTIELGARTANQNQNQITTQTYDSSLGDTVTNTITTTSTTFTNTLFQSYGYSRTTGAESGKLSAGIFKSYLLTNGVTVTLEKYLE